MSVAALTVLALAVALTAAAWAGLLALAEESPAIARTMGEEAVRGAGYLPAYRAFHVSRLALLIMAGVAAAQAVGWWNRPPLAAWTTALLAAAFLYLLADALPRAVGILVPDVATAAAQLARRIMGPFRPLISTLSVVERGVNALLPAPRRAAQLLGPAQRDILLGVFSLADTTVADIMTPRLDVVAVELSTEWPEVVELLRRGEHARVPVYNGTLDDIVGVLHARDLVPAVAGLAPRPRWQDRIRPVQFVPESKTLDRQLHDFQRGPSHLAIVVDEFGGTSGLVTLEDILEEVVGEIRDEYDVDEEPALEQEGENRFWVDARVTLDQLSGYLGVTIEHDDVHTVGGLIYSELGRVPEPGEELSIAGFRVVVERVVGRRIGRVYFERVPSGSEAEAVEEAEP